MKKINFFLEDPGSSNFVLGLQKNLKKYNIEIEVYAAGFAQKYLKKYCETSKKFNLKKISEIINCDFLVIGTSENKNTPAKNLFFEAKKKEVLTGLIIDAPTFVQQRLLFSEFGKINDLIDFFFIIDDDTEKILINNRIEKKKIIKVSNPKFSYVKSYEKKIYKKKNKKQIAFLSELSDGMKKEEFLKNSNYTFKGYSGSEKRTEIILEEFLTEINKYKNVADIHLRLHPKEKKSAYKKYFSKINRFSISENSTKFIRRMDLVVGMTTNLISEARVLGKQCLSIIPRNKEASWINSDIRPFINFAKNKKEIQLFFKKFFNPKYNDKLPKIDLKKNEFSLMLKKIVNEKNII